MKKIITSICNTQQSGFTLLETLFAVIIFSFALVSLIGITGKGVTATLSAKQQLTAQYLAEELLEVARNTRDGNFLSGVDWNAGILECTTSTPCDVSYADANYLTLQTCSSGACGELSENLGEFRPVDQSSGGLPSGFSRELVFKDLGNNQAKLTATVTWRQKNLIRNFELSTYIADWYTLPATPTNP